MTHGDVNLTPYASFLSLTRGFIGFAIPKNPCIQNFMIFI